jgi:hypothetical protein
VATLVAFIGADALEDRPRLFTQMVLSTAIISGGALAFARVQFEWAATLIKRDIEDKKVQKEDALAESRREWPSGPERLWKTSFLSLAFGWIIMFIGIWWPQIAWILCRLRCG